MIFFSFKLKCLEWFEGEDMHSFENLQDCKIIYNSHSFFESFDRVVVFIAYVAKLNSVFDCFSDCSAAEAFDVLVSKKWLWDL